MATEADRATMLAAARMRLAQAQVELAAAHSDAEAIAARRVIDDTLDTIELLGGG